jgi:hypothetical protein
MGNRTTPLRAGSILAALFLLPSVAMAERRDGTRGRKAPTTGIATPMPTASGTGSAPLSPTAMSGAEDPGSISRRALDRLEPKRSRLPNNPYQHTDFTAYTLEFGEVRLGLASIRAGIAPRTQVGTVPAALAVGALNGHAKVDLLRIGPVDIAATGTAYSFKHEDFSARNLQAGGVTSVRIMPKWSMHVGTRYQSTHAEGMPDFQKNPWIVELAAPDLAAQANQLEQAGGPSTDQVYAQASNRYSGMLEAQALTVKLATDIRLNRRDSLILQAQANVWSDFQSTLPLDEIPGDVPYAQQAIESLQSQGITETYITSVAWHFSWHRADLRLGAGLSSTPGAWVTQTADFAWRFGGPTRRSETRMTRSWKHNRKDLRRASRHDAPTPDAG